MRKSGKKTSSKPDVLVLNMEELDDLVDRIRRSGVSDEDCEKLGALVDTVAWLHQELDNKNLTVARLRSLFGLNSSEKTKDVLAEGAVAEEGEVPSGDDVPEKEKKKAAGHGRKAAADYVGAKRVKLGHDSLKAGELCPACPKNKQGKVYSLAPKTLVRVTGQAPLQATVFERERLRCNLCGRLFVAKLPAGVGSEKYDAKAAAMIGLLKYGSGLPFNRLERLEGNLGIPLPAATQWEIVKDAAEGLRPVYRELIVQAAQGRLMHNDDTSMEVLELRKEIDELKRSGKTDRTGIFSTSIVSELADGHRVSLFITGRKHAGENLADLLTKRAAELGPPIQMCDGLDRNLPKEFEAVLSNCLAHGRRKFVEVNSSFPEECRHVLETLRDVYKHDADAHKLGLSDDERLDYHQKHSRPLMDGLEEWMHKQFKEKLVEPNSSLGKAITYMTKRWDKLTLFLREPGAPLDNNISERALKKAILHRRNSLFYKTENGARVGDLFMGLIHTAELLRVNPFDYLTALLEHVADTHVCPERWMPWNYAAALAESTAPKSTPPA